MAVTVVMRVKVPDWERFHTAWMEATNANPTADRLSSRVLRRDSDENEVLILEEWTSHDAWHSYGDSVGGEFVERSGLGDADWDDTVWNEA